MIVTEVIDKWPPVRDSAAMAGNLRAPRTGATRAQLAYAGTRIRAERHESPWVPYAFAFVAGVIVGVVLMVGRAWA